MTATGRLSGHVWPLRERLNPHITDPADVREMIAAMPEPHLIPRPVGKAVGNVRNNGPQLIEPLEL